jgi:hypothetical protein
MIYVDWVSPALSIFSGVTACSADQDTIPTLSRWIV